MKKKILVLGFLIFNLSLVSQSFTVALDIGHTVELSTTYGNVDYNITGEYNKYIISIGVISDTKALDKGWGRRLSIGKRVYDDWLILGSVSFTDHVSETLLGYGFNIGYGVTDHFTLFIGPDTVRGVRFGISCGI